MAYLLPGTAFFCLLAGGAWSWLTFAFVYLVIPIADRWAGSRTEAQQGGASVATMDTATGNALLFSAIPVQFALLGLFLLTWQDPAAGVWERAGWISAVGLSCGGFGITIAHELVHRREPQARWAGKLLLMSVLYMHFAIEHVRGHHQRVATDEDPASARFGQNVYAFALQSIYRQYRSAWALEVARLTKRGASVWSVHNEMLHMGVLQAVWLALIAGLAGWGAMLAYLGVAAVAVGLLEVVNYVEHYGLRRRRDTQGRWEPVRAHHSWNSDHVFSRALLFELPRHTDHHMNGGRPFHTLQSVEAAPQLPAGYPEMVLLALLPPLWFRAMNPRAAAILAQPTA